MFWPRQSMHFIVCQYLEHSYVYHTLMILYHMYMRKTYIYICNISKHTYITLPYLPYITLHYIHACQISILSIHACMPACIHTHIHTCMHACMHACIHTRIYMYIRYILMMCVHSPQYIKTHERPECSTHPPGTSPKAAR